MAKIWPVGCGTHFPSLIREIPVDITENCPLGSLGGIYRESGSVALLTGSHPRVLGWAGVSWREVVESLS